jgi:hypothetical protein
MLNVVPSPPLSKEGDVKFNRLDSSRFSNDRSKYVVFLLLLLPTEGPEFACPRDTARNGLVDVDMFDAFIVLEVLNGEGDLFYGHDVTTGQGTGRKDLPW